METKKYSFYQDQRNKCIGSFSAPYYERPLSFQVCVTGEHEDSNHLIKTKLFSQWVLFTSNILYHVHMPTFQLSEPGANYLC